MPSNSRNEESGYVGDYHYAVCVLSLLYGVDVRNGKCLAHILWIKNERVKFDVGTTASKSIGFSLKSGTFPANCETNHIIIYRLRLLDAASSILGLNNK